MEQSSQASEEEKQRGQFIQAGRSKIWSILVESKEQSTRCFTKQRAATRKTVPEERERERERERESVETGNQ